MIDNIELKLGPDRVLRLSNPEGGAPQFDAIEITFDHHYAIRIQPDGEWTAICFREGGTWSKAQVTRWLARDQVAVSKPKSASQTRKPAKR